MTDSARGHIPVFVGCHGCFRLWAEVLELKREIALLKGETPADEPGRDAKEAECQQEIGK